MIKVNSSNASKKVNPILAAQSSSRLYDNSTMSVNSDKKMKTLTTGKGWHNLEPAKVDDKLKRDLQAIQMRNYIDPKRFYKNPDKPGTVLHVGTVIEGPSEYKSARLSKRERKQTILEELMTDEKTKNYTKRVFLDIQHEKSKKKRFDTKKSFKKQKHAKKIRAYF